MPEQTIQLQAAWYRVAHNSWVAPAGSRPAIDAGLRGADDRFLRSIILTPEGEVRLAIESSQTSIASNDDLTSEFEQNGSLELIVSPDSLLVALAGADMTETYRWTPSNSAEVIAFEALLSDVAGARIRPVNHPRLRANANSGDGLPLICMRQRWRRAMES